MGNLNNSSKKLIEFYDAVAQSENFRQQVLFSFAEFFNFEHSTFFLTDFKGQFLIDPVALNMDRHITNVYCDYYQKIDIFNPQNLSEYNSKKKILYITDIIPLKQFEKTEHYNVLLKKQYLYHEITISFFDQERMVGGIAIFKPKKEKFNNEDRTNIKYIYNFLSGMLYKNLVLQRAVYNEKIYQNCVKESPAGTIVFNEDLSIIFSNDAAYETVSEISSKRRDLKKFVEQIVSLSGTAFNSGTYTLDLYSPSLNEFTIRISPLSNFSGFDQKTYLLTLIPKYARIDKANDINIQKIFGLTNRELEVLNLLVRGKTNEEIAKELFISFSTVKAHLRSIYSKTDTTNRVKLYNKLNEIQKTGKPNSLER